MRRRILARFAALALLLCCLCTALCAALADDAVKLLFHTEEGETEEVEMAVPGIVFSQVKSDGQVITVASSDLEWDTEAEAGKGIAYISAPNTGRSQVLRKPNGGSKTMGRLKTGKIVMVMTAPSGKFIGIDYYGKIGYVLTATIAYPNTKNGVQTGLVCTKDGTTTGKQTINLRMRTSRRSRKIAAIKVGTPVTVYGINKGWAEVDADGWHGYLMEEYIALDGSGITLVGGDPVTEDATPEPTPAATPTPPPMADDSDVDEIEEFDLGAD